MQFFATSGDIHPVNIAELFAQQFVTGQTEHELFQLSTARAMMWNGYSKGKLLIDPEHFIGLELSLVEEVEQVFVDRKGIELQVTAVVNERDPDVRAKVYVREQSVMDEFPYLGFDFRVITRMGRHLSDIVDYIGKTVYQR